ncbi:MAG: hypothetical protein INR69_02350 [Mucilaginibacter polytrichastri]|nr:hypothetical protein [Mucilaginibacter polytrichastri]
MKKELLYILAVFTLIFSACQKYDDAEGTLSPITAIEDIRNLHKGGDVTLNRENLRGAYQMTGVVISDFSAGNAKPGLVVIQNNRRQKIRGIALQLGEAAKDYLPGDSLLIGLEGGNLQRTGGSLQISSIAASAITKISSGNTPAIQSVTANTLVTRPGDYESTLVSVEGTSVRPLPLPGEKFAGNKTLITGADSLVMHTEAGAAFAQDDVYASLNITGLVFGGQNAAGAAHLEIWPRSLDDLENTSDPVGPGGDLGVSPIVISGFANDVAGADGNHEYVQLMATTDINFAETPFALVTCTNAGSATPNQGAAPGAGWATGGGRSYKFNLTEGSVSKGEIFYVGGSARRINGPNSTDISGSKWIRSITYTTTNGDGIGNASSGLMPNSGNAGGIAVFAGTIVTEESKPVDVVFYGGKGTTTMVNAEAGLGYRVADNDHYSAVNAEDQSEQSFFYQGTNSYVIPHATPADQGIFVKLGGSFNAATRTWTTARSFEFFVMTKQSDISAIETGNITQITE